MTALEIHQIEHFVLRLQCLVMSCSCLSWYLAPILGSKELHVGLGGVVIIDLCAWTKQTSSLFCCADTSFSLLANSSLLQPCRSHDVSLFTVLPSVFPVLSRSLLVHPAPGNTSSEAPASIFSSSALMVAQVFATNLSLPVSKIMFKFTAGVPMPKLPVGVDPTTCCR